MSTVSETLGGDGPGVPFTALGETFHLTPVGPALRAAFSSWCRVWSQEDLRRRKAEFTPEQYAEEQAALRRDVRLGLYSWGTPLEKEALGQAVADLFATPEGEIAYLQLALHKAHGKVPTERILQIVQDNPEGVKDALMESLDLVPNWPTPESRAATTGLSKTDQWRKYHSWKAARWAPDCLRTILAAETGTATGPTPTCSPS